MSTTFWLGVILIGGVLLAAVSSPVPPLPFLAGAIGLFALHHQLRAEVGASIALLTASLLFGATSLFWTMTHAVSTAEAVAFAGAAVAVAAAAHVRPSGARILLWSVAAIIPVVLRWVVASAPVNADAAPAPGLVASLFSASHGFLSLTPVVYLAVIGTLASLWRTRPRGWPHGSDHSRTASVPRLLAVIAITMSGMVRPAAGPFDHGLTATLPLVAPGLALALASLRARPLLLVAPLVLSAIAWNYWLMIQFTAGAIPKDAPVSFATLVRQQADVATRTPYVYPFAFPANVLFAWREGVPVDRFELLSSEPRRSTIDVSMDRRADRFLLDGWEATSSINREAVRWTAQPRASIVVPLTLTGSGMQVSLSIRARLEEPAVDALMALEINGHAIGRFVAPAAAAADVTFNIAPRDVGRIFRDGYNRVTIVNHGVQRVDPSDERPPGPLASRPGSRAWPVAVYRMRLAPA